MGLEPFEIEESHWRDVRKKRKQRRLILANLSKSKTGSSKNSKSSKSPKQLSRSTSALRSIPTVMNLKKSLKKSTDNEIAQTISLKQRTLGPAQYSGKKNTTPSTPPTKKEQIIASLFLFSSLTTKEISCLTNVMKIQTYFKADYIFRKGEPSDSFIVIVSGTANVVLPGGQHIPRSEGEFFGERGMLKNASVHSADVVVSSKEGMTALVMSRLHFRSLSSSHRAVYDAVIQAMKQYTNDARQNQDEEEMHQDQEKKRTTPKMNNRKTPPTTTAPSITLLSKVPSNDDNDNDNDNNDNHDNNDNKTPTTDGSHVSTSSMDSMSSLSSVSSMSTFLNREGEEIREGKVHWHLAKMYLNGELGAEDPSNATVMEELDEGQRSSALYYLNQAAECGDCEACYALARLHENFTSNDDLPNLKLDEDEVDIKHAGRFYETAANGGNLEACVRIAKAYYNANNEDGDNRGDLGVNIDASKSLQFWNLADQHVGVRDSSNNVEKEYGQIERWTTTAAMAHLYHKSSTEKNPSKAYELYSAAGELAMNGGKFKLGTEYMMLAEEAGYEIEDDVVVEEDVVVEDVVAEEEVVLGVAKKVVAKVDERLLLLQEVWKKNLYEGVLPFWLNNSIDDVHGGYYTCLDHNGEIYDDTKYSWLQGRQVYMFSHVYNESFENEEIRMKCLIGASCGIDFLNKALDTTTGYLFFSTSKDGKSLLHLQRKPYSAVFYVQGMLEYYRALVKYQTYLTNSNKPSSCTDRMKQHLENPIQFFQQAESMFQHLLEWIEDPSKCGRPKTTNNNSNNGHRTTQLADVMCAASLALDFIVVLNEIDVTLLPSTYKKKNYYLNLIETAMNDCLRHYDTRNNRNIFLETVCGDTITSSTPEERLFCPGHSIEVVWFLLQMCDVVGGSERHEKVALDVLKGSLVYGWDEKNGYGGLMYMMDIEGKPLVDATVTADGKLWWPHTEALIALTMAYTRTKDVEWLKWLEKVHTYSYKTFVTNVTLEGKTNESTNESTDEWYGYCNRDGSVARSSKGGNYKGCFHVPRALLMCVNEVDKMLK